MWAIHPSVRAYLYVLPGRRFLTRLFCFLFPILGPRPHPRRRVRDALEHLKTLVRWLQAGDFSCRDGYEEYVARTLKQVGRPG